MEQPCGTPGQKNHLGRSAQRLGFAALGLLLCLSAALGEVLPSESGTGLLLGATTTSHNKTVALTQAGHYAKSEGRELYTLEWILSGQWRNRYALWLGYETITALGVAVGNHFRATAVCFGGSAVLHAREGHVLSATYEGVRAGTGYARYNPESTYRAVSVAHLEGPTAHTFALCYTLVGHQTNAWCRSTFSTAGVGQRKSQAIGLGVGFSRRLLAGLTGSAEGTAFYQTTSGLRFYAGGPIKAHFRAQLTYQPASWAALYLGGDYFPTSVPFAGTALTGFSSFNLYEPETLILGRLRTKNALFANAALTLRWHW